MTSSRSCSACWQDILLPQPEEIVTYYWYGNSRFPVSLLQVLIFIKKGKKGKVIPLQARCGPEDG